MALSEFQQVVCRLLARNRIETGESYVAGGTALNAILRSPRQSRDIDLFHDTDEALNQTWSLDRKLLEAEGYGLEIVRDMPAFKEIILRRSGESVIIQWLRDSAYRFFPLVEDERFGLALHRFDLAVNKVLALVGRLEPRDWVDVLQCDEKLQPLGYLVWAACGKDPGFSPLSLIQEARRSGRYSQDELNELSFEGGPPKAEELGKHWHTALKTAEEICSALPENQVGACVLNETGDLFRGGMEELKKSLQAGRVRFHKGSIRGVWPTVR